MPIAVIPTLLDRGIICCCCIQSDDWGLLQVPVLGGNIKNFALLYTILKDRWTIKNHDWMALILTVVSLRYDGLSRRKAYKNIILIKRQ
jgi:hypothetical protein